MDKTVAQLLLQVDANVAVAQRELQNLARIVRTSSDGMNEAINDNVAAHGRLNAAMGNTRIAQMELSHVITASSDAYAAGASPIRILTMEMGRLAQAAAFMGGGSGMLGKLAGFMQGPWGIAVMLGVGVLGQLILKHHEAADTVDSLLEKLQKHKEQTALSAQAEDIWAHSIDGVIESNKKLNEELEKRLKLQSLTDQSALASAQQTVAERGQQLAEAEGKYDNGDERVKKAAEAFSEAVKTLNALQTIVGEQEGAALADTSKAADQWADRMQNFIRVVQRMHPELSAFGGQLAQAFSEVKAAASKAGGAGINLQGPNGITNVFDQLNEKLRQSPSFIQTYISELKRLAGEITDFTARAQNAPKAIDDFKRSLVGAEGLGPNKMGSAAAGYGQFMPSTFEHYFREAYPSQAGLSNAVIDDLRNNKQVAEGVIDVATKDYVAVLKSAGQQITAAALYTVHLLGAGDARKLFAASPNTPTSSFLSGAVLRGNPFLQGTAGDARAAIASRIGDSSSAVSSGAQAVQKSLDEQAALMDKINTRAQDEWHAEQKITLEKGEQVNYVQEYNAQNKETLIQLAEANVNMTEWNHQYERLIAAQKELSDFGGQMIDEIFNPDNWSNWGDMGKRILHEIEMEFIKLAAINPLKNLLFGQNNPTLGGVLSNLLGGGHSGIPSFSTAGVDFSAANMESFGFHFASGGSFMIGGRGGTDNNVMSINGRKVANVSRGETVAVIPQAARMNFGSANGGGGGGDVTIHQTFEFQGVAVTKDEFVQGLIATKSETMHAIREVNRRKS